MGDSLGVRWRFLRPWSAPIRGKLRVVHERSPSVPRARFSGLELLLFGSKGAMSMSADQLLDARHALVLLALVARADLRAWRHVLSKFCGLVEAEALDLDETEERATSRFSLSLGMEDEIEDFEAKSNGLQSFLAVLDAPPSARFVKTAVKIASMGGNLQQVLDVSLGIVIDGRQDGAVCHVQRVCAKLQKVQAKHKGWCIPIHGGRHISAEDGDIAVPECAIVLDPIHVDLAGDIFTPERAVMAGSLAEFGQGARLHLRSHAAFDDEDVDEAMRVLGNMYNQVLGVDSRHNQATMKSIDLHCGNASIAQMRNLCYSIAQAQSTSTLTLRFEHESMESLSRKKLWTFLAHALFSKHAKAHSTITNVSLHDIVLSELDATTLDEALSTDDIVNFLPTVNDNIGIDNRIYMLKKGTLIIHQPHDAGAPLSSLRWELESDVYGVKIVDTDIEDFIERTNLSGDESLASVPGYGVCLVPRAHILPVDDERKPIGGEVDTLNLSFSEGHWVPEVAAGLHTLLRRVGGPLRHLSLEFTANTPENLASSLQFCPSLETLIVSGYIASSSAFVETYKAHNLRIAVIDCQFDDLEVLALALADKASYLSRNVKRIVFDFLTRWDSSQQQQFRAVLDMLERNRTLEYVRINVPSEVFGTVSDAVKRHHNQPLPAIKAPISLLNRFAFLSVLRTKFRTSLEQAVVQLIFNFASDSRFRSVVVGKWHTSHFNWQ